jgi:IS5 family transposase
MNSFMSSGWRQAYSRLAKLGDPISEANKLLDWERFRPIAEGLYNNKTEKGGHPNIDAIPMIKILVLQQWYGISDQRMERELTYNLSFMNFLGFPGNHSRFLANSSFLQQKASARYQDNVSKTCSTLRHDNFMVVAGSFDVNPFRFRRISL